MDDNNAETAIATQNTRLELPGNVTGDFCSVDITLHSPGIWASGGSKPFLEYELPRLQLQLAIIFILTQSLHLVFRRFHLPRIVSEILVFPLSISVFFIYLLMVSWILVYFIRLLLQ